MAITLRFILQILIIVAGKENQLSNRTYFALMPTDIACFSIERADSGEVVKAFWRRLNPTVLLSIHCLAGLIRTFEFAELKRLKATGTNELPSVQPRVSIRKPFLFLLPSAWSLTQHRSSTALLLVLLKKESSITNASARSSVVSGAIWWFITLAESNKRNLCQLICIEFRNL